jgi:hypothetical protein
MMRFVQNLALSTCLITLLASCATGPAHDAGKPTMLTQSTAAAENPTMATVGLPADFAGAWFVTGAFPVGSAHGNGGDRHIGVAVLLKDDDVSDVNGQHCAHPTFAEDTVTADSVDLKLTVTGAIKRLQVSCAGKAFATLLQVPGQSLPGADASAGTAMLDGSAGVLLAQRPEALYLMERAEQVLYRQALVSHGSMPTLVAASPHETSTKTMSKTEGATLKTAEVAHEKAVTEPKVKASDTTAHDPKMKSMIAAAPPGPVETKAAQSKTKKEAPKAAAEMALAKPTATSPKLGTAIHLASYTGMNSAARGWQVLHDKYPELAALKPLYVTVDLADKGTMIRLFATGAKESKLKQICSDLQAKQAYCTLHP